MERHQEGEWHVFKEKTQKPFERVKLETTRALMSGFPGLFTTHRWKGHTCHITGMGAKGTIVFDHGEIICRASVHSFPSILVKGKILADIENATREVAGVIDSENKDVFIVHGHNETHRFELQKLLFGMGLRPIVLVEQDDRGLTIVEKFEYYASSCSFSFILMTPDDKAGGGSDVESRWRARQNVIMELGWFMARLGRERVIILYTGELEIPSDILGVVYLQFKENIAEVESRIRQRLKGVGLIS